MDDHTPLSPEVAAFAAAVQAALAEHEHADDYLTCPTWDLVGDFGDAGEPVETQAGAIELAAKLFMLYMRSRAQGGARPPWINEPHD